MDYIPEIISGITGGGIVLIGRWLKNHDSLTKVKTDIEWLKAAVERIESKLDKI